MTVDIEDELMKKVCTYVVSGNYPDESSKNEKRIIRRKDKKFVLNIKGKFIIFVPMVLR